ncbi:HD domain-containing phosphohydrolase [Vibrio sp. 03_296]|uniref:HD-GYP domain-containing protein n=1 Tax=Vibrio sp. 03_296 TaxID=2024409 RepID=UPI002D7FEF4F|nr:HD domain-containing phosphohydrolase [Vibrio sp. 03_296]
MTMTSHLMNGKSEFEDIYFHSLNVSVIAMMIGRAKGFSAAQLKELSFAALFHDIGKIKIPSAIVRKDKRHSQILSLIISNCIPSTDWISQYSRMVSCIVRKGIAQHHELNDGSGYPDGLKEHEIDELTQVNCGGECFRTLCHHNIPTEQKIPYTALSHLILRTASTFIVPRT